MFERLIARHDKMKPVYAELQELHVIERSTLDPSGTVYFAGTFATADNHAGLRADYSELQSLSEDIPARLCGWKRCCGAEATYLTEAEVSP